MGRPAETLRVFRLEGGIEGAPQRLAPATFAGVGALEVQHIEHWLRRNPDLLGEELLVIASQFSGFDRTRDRPDLLALDRSGKLVVIEIKRDESGSGQDLQALRYAAYIATLQAADVVRLYGAYVQRERGATLDEDAAREELEAFAPLDELDEDERPRIVLVAGRFQVGVTNTVLWLARTYGLDISCVQLTPFEVEGQLLVTSTTLIPLPEAADFEVRVQGEAAARVGSSRPRQDRLRARAPIHGLDPSRTLDDLRRRRGRCRSAARRTGDRHLGAQHTKRPQRLARAPPRRHRQSRLAGIQRRRAGHGSRRDRVVAARRRRVR